MDTERNLLFGVVALQNGTVDADRLAETCAMWASKPDASIGDLFVGQGLMTIEQKTELEEVVARELESHGGDAEATLAATMDARSLEAIRDVASSGGSLEAKLSLPSRLQGGHVPIGKISTGDVESRDRYTLTHLHAKGGMGRVWLARDSSLGREIALKDLRPEQADNSIVWSRFLYEAKITAQLEHPGIVPVYEVGEGDSPYYTMRFVRGRTLCEATRAYHKKRAAGEADSLGLIELLTAFVGVCHAVAYAHSRGIIHRDLKGQNVVLGDYGEVMVLDWGLAKRVGPDQRAGAPDEVEIPDPAVGQDANGSAVATIDTGSDNGRTLPEGNDDRLGMRSQPSSASNGHAIGSNGHAHNSSPNSGTGASRRPMPESGAGPDGTMQGQLLGTPAYMAPEQAQGRHDLVDERTDVYGLGAILYEILTGRPPFIAPKTSEIIRKVCQENATPPRQIVPLIGPGLEAICLKAIRKDKNGRYESAAELAIDVQRFMADEPVHAYTEPWTDRARRWARRHRTAVSTAAGLLITATIALGISTTLVSAERNEAESQGKQARQAVNLLTQVKDIGFEDQLDPKQKEFLEHALAWYENFTGQRARDPQVRLEHGLAYQQMGDIQRKLGKMADSERAYRKAAEILEPLAAAPNATSEARQALARTRTLLGNLLFRTGGDKDQMQALYSQALAVQEPLAKAAGATTEDRLRFGQTLKSEADLLRLKGRFRDAKIGYDKALSALEQALTLDPKHNDVRNEVALAADARGLVSRELGEPKAAEKDFEQALGVLDGLVAEFPTISRYRESLAKVCNSLGVLAQDTGDSTAAERYLRRELPLVERLAQDFPGRPEHTRELGRTLYNLGFVLTGQNRFGEADPLLRRAVDITTAIAVKNPDDVQIRFDLAKSHHNLGELLLSTGDLKGAVIAFQKTGDVNGPLFKSFPDSPRYAHLQAVNLASLAHALSQLDQPKVEETYRSALTIFDKLVADHPENVEYRIGHARCVRNLGPVLAAKGQTEQAEVLYNRALDLLAVKANESNVAGSLMRDRLRGEAAVLNNLGELHSAGAETALRRSIAVSKRLVEQKSPANADLQNMAIAEYNLALLLVDRKRAPEAATLIDQAVQNFETIVAAAPKAIDYQSQFGLILEKQASLLLESRKIAEAKAALEKAVAHQRSALRLSRNRDDVRGLLGGHLLELANVNLELGAYKEAAANALELPTVVPQSNRDQGCFDAARVLARLVTRVSADQKLTQADRDQFARQYLGRTVVLLREAIDANPKLSPTIKSDSDIKALESRPGFQTIMNSLVTAAN